MDSDSPGDSSLKLEQSCILVNALCLGKGRSHYGKKEQRKNIS